MFRETLVAGILALSMTCTSVMAQTEAPPPGAPPQGETMMPPPSAEGAPVVKPMRQHRGGRAVIMSCRSRAMAQGLSGGARRHAVLACVRAKRPALASRMVCRHKGHRLGIAFRTGQMHAFVRKCLGRRSV
jgi:hypothetical protein